MSSASSIRNPGIPGPATHEVRSGPVLRGEHQAIVVIERRMGRSSDQKNEPMAPGWQWVLGNARVGQLYDRLFADAQLTWSSLVVPEEHQATFAAVAAHTAGAGDESTTPTTLLQHVLLPYNGDLQINSAALPKPPDKGEGLYLIFNGHRFPLCDLQDAIQVHRNNRCDATLIEFVRARRKEYNEHFQLDGTGQVKRVNRHYGAAGGNDSLLVERDWPVMMIVSADAMRALLDVSLPQRTSQWPLAMLRAGLLVRGSAISGHSFSLHDRDHLYELNEAILRLKPEWLAEAGGLVDQGERIWVGKNVRINSSANLLGPLAIGDDVEIGAGAVIVGPTTIGRGCKIGAGIVLKRSVVLPDTTLAGATLKTHSLSTATTLGGDQPSLQAFTATEAPELHVVHTHGSTMSSVRPIRLEKVLEAGAVPALGGFGYKAFSMTKRAMDVAGAIPALFVGMFLFPIIALAIRINSPGPIFYGHVRQGRGGKNFKVWKFRTMVLNAEEIKRKLMLKNEVDGPQFKMKDDPRIFAVGKWLRRLNLDEVPQFFNVLIGQMSLVGPRPSPDRENQMCPAWREARLTVRPGITGLWQVMRKREGETDFQEWIYYDVQYIKKQSLWLDLKILARTIVVAAGGGQ